MQLSEVVHRFFMFAAVCLAAQSVSDRVAASPREAELIYGRITSPCIFSADVVSVSSSTFVHPYSGPTQAWFVELRILERLPDHRPLKWNPPETVRAWTRAKPVSCNYDGNQVVLQPGMRILTGMAAPRDVHPWPKVYSGLPQTGSQSLLLEGPGIALLDEVRLWRQGIRDVHKTGNGSHLLDRALALLDSPSRVLRLHAWHMLEHPSVSCAEGPGTYHSHSIIGRLSDAQVERLLRWAKTLANSDEIQILHQVIENSNADVLPRVMEILKQQWTWDPSLQYQPSESLKQWQIAQTISGVFTHANQKHRQSLAPLGDWVVRHRWPFEFLEPLAESGWEPARKRVFAILADPAHPELEAIMHHALYWPWARAIALRQIPLIRNVEVRRRIEESIQVSHRAREITARLKSASDSNSARASSPYTPRSTR